MTLQPDGTRQECLPGRHDDASAAFLRAAVYGLLYGALVLRCRCLRLGAELGYQVVVAADLRLLDALFYLPVCGFVPALCLGNKRVKETVQTEERRI